MPRKKKNPENSSAWTVYIIETRTGKLYTGITTDVQRRFEEHAQGKKGARYFRTAAPSRVVYTEPCATRGEASRREAAIKRLTRQQKLEMIQDT